MSASGPLIAVTSPLRGCWELCFCIHPMGTPAPLPPCPKYQHLSISPRCFVCVYGGYFPVKVFFGLICAHPLRLATLCGYHSCHPKYNVTEHDLPPLTPSTSGRHGILVCGVEILNGFLLPGLPFPIKPILVPTTQQEPGTG